MPSCGTTCAPRCTCIPPLCENTHACSCPRRYYSFDIPGVAHMVFITTYIPDDPQTTNTSQYRWLEADLKAVDRKKTCVGASTPFARLAAV